MRNELHSCLISRLYPGEVLHVGIMRTGLGHAIDVANMLDVFTTTALFKDSKGPE